MMEKALHRETFCPVCKSDMLQVFLTRKKVPVHQNLLFDDEKSAVNSVRGDLTLTVCEECGFIFNKTFEPSKLSYGDKYDNCQVYSPSFNQYVSNLVHHLVVDKKVINSTIIEIGCGNGYFLKQLIENKDWNNTGIGYDPSYQGNMIEFDGRLKFEKRFFDIDCTNTPVNAFISRHVIEHIPNPVSLLQSLSTIIQNSEDIRVFFETPTVEWILENKVIWDFVYEHCSYFSPVSLKTAFNLVGLDVIETQVIFGGQYLWMEAKHSPRKPEIIKDAGQIPLLARSFALSEDVIKKRWEDRLTSLAEKGNVALWGAAAKGTTLANMVDPERKLINCIIDVNPKKWGKYISGTGHPIVNYTSIEKREIKSVVVMNPNYYSEIEELLKKSNLSVDLIN